MYKLTVLYFKSLLVLKKIKFEQKYNIKKK